uniref:receptor protein serine/threonine kinase n=1 Tax=Suberites domuncula TaxID=55567 RepID=A0A374XYX3_SUBDO|nr:BMPR_SD [Suberites domuncula]
METLQVISLFLLCCFGVGVTGQATCYCDTETADCIDNSCILELASSHECIVDYNVNTKKLRHHCLQPFLTCHSGDDVISSCCNHNSSCNRCLVPEGISYEICITLTLPDGCPPLNCSQDISPTPAEDFSPKYLILCVLLGVIVVVVGIVLVVIIVCVCWARRRCTHQVGKLSPTPSQCEKDSFDSRYVGMSSSGVTQGRGRNLEERTIADDICKESMIARGGYGEVWKCSRHGDPVAVKIFVKDSEESCERERKIYTSGLLRHPNIVEYIATDKKCLHFGIELWLIMKYYRYGSLDRHIINNSITPVKAHRILYSITSALHFLHNPVNTSYGVAYGGIAHRDLKTPNILVEDERGNCVVTDFGLSVLADDFKPGAPPVKVMVGTKRYMAPEVLNGTINTNELDAFCVADMYAFGLVMWEILRRAETNGKASEHQIPYQNSLCEHPTIDDIRRVVVEQCVRPELEERWKDDECLSVVSNLMKECWTPSPDGRPTATRIKKKLETICYEMKNGF